MRQRQFTRHTALADPVEIGGDEAKASDAECYNRALVLALGGDHCHDLCHLLRLPGTLNLPGANKRKRGRRRAPACVVEADWTRTYRLDQLPKAPPPKGFPSPAGARPAALPADLPCYATVDDIPELEGDDHAWLRALIVQGTDPDRHPPYPSRSEALFAALCGMARAGCSDVAMAAVILDPGFGISASIIDKPNSRKCARRQIERARDEAPPLRATWAAHSKPRAPHWPI
jgi:hypothetical protein